MSIETPIIARKRLRKGDWRMVKIQILEASVKGTRCSFFFCWVRVCCDQAKTRTDGSEGLSHISPPTTYHLIIISVEKMHFMKSPCNKDWGTPHLAKKSILGTHALRLRRSSSLKIILCIKELLLLGIKKLMCRNRNGSLRIPFGGKTKDRIFLGKIYGAGM